MSISDREKPLFTFRRELGDIAKFRTEFKSPFEGAYSPERGTILGVDATLLVALSPPKRQPTNYVACNLRNIGVLFNPFPRRRFDPRSNPMYHHIKKLMFTVHVNHPDPRFGNMLLEQFGGANGELAAAMQYSIQGINCDHPECKDLLWTLAPRS